MEERHPAEVQIPSEERARLVRDTGAQDRETPQSTLLAAAKQCGFT